MKVHCDLPFVKNVKRGALHPSGAEHLKFPAAPVERIHQRPRHVHAEDPVELMPRLPGAYPLEVQAAHHVFVCSRNIGSRQGRKLHPSSLCVCTAACMLQYHIRYQAALRVKIAGADERIRIPGKLGYDLYPGAHPPAPPPAHLINWHPTKVEDGEAPTDASLAHSVQVPEGRDNRDLPAAPLESVYWHPLHRSPLGSPSAQGIGDLPGCAWLLADD